MTKEEIQKNSEHWYNKYKDAEKRIAELEAQIEKMKCCENCIHEINEDDVIVQTDYCDNCFEFCYWKLRR